MTAHQTTSPIFNAAGSGAHLNCRSFGPDISSFAALTDHGYRRIGIFGGTFDPIHLGHLLLPQYAMERLGLDCAVFVPAYQNPLKENAPIASDDERFAMVKATVTHDPRLFLSNWELQRGAITGQPSYTIDLLRTIHEQAEGKAKLFLFVGSDNVLTLHRWKDYKKILPLAEIVLVPRDGESVAVIEQARATLGDKVTDRLKRNFLAVTLPSISSSTIRQAYATGTNFPDPWLSPEARAIADAIYRK